MTLSVEDLTAQVETLLPEDGSASIIATSEAVYLVNKNNGWFDIKRPFSADIALLHTEITEALIGFDRGDLDNFREEVADIYIRLLDTGRRQNFSLSGLATHVELNTLANPGNPDSVSIPLLLLSVHRTVSTFYETYRENKTEREQKNAFGDIVVALHELIQTADIDVAREVRRKVLRNATRGYKHGGKAE